MRKDYSIEQIENFINDYIDLGGEIFQVGDEVLGLGTIILYNNGTKYGNYVIKEVYVNPWSSTHTLTRYTQLPKKYRKILIENGLMEEGE